MTPIETATKRVSINSCSPPAYFVMLPLSIRMIVTDKIPVFMSYKTHLVRKMPQIRKTRATLKHQVMANLVISSTSAMGLYKEIATGTELKFLLIHLLLVYTQCAISK